MYILKISNKQERWLKAAKSGLKTSGKVWKSWSAIKGLKIGDSKLSKILCKLLVSVDRFFSGGSVCIVLSGVNFVQQSNKLSNINFI